MTPYFARLAERSVGHAAAAPRRADFDGWAERHEETSAASSSTAAAPAGAAPTAAASSAEIGPPSAGFDAASRVDRTMTSAAPTIATIPRTASTIAAAAAPSGSTSTSLRPRPAPTAEGGEPTAPAALPAQTDGFGSATRLAAAVVPNETGTGARASKAPSVTPAAREQEAHAAERSSRGAASAAVQSDGFRPHSPRPAGDSPTAATADRSTAQPWVGAPAARTNDAAPPPSVRAQPAAAGMAAMPKLAATARADRTAAVSVHIGRVDVEVVAAPPRPPQAAAPVASASRPPTPAAAFNPHRHYLRSG
jgi:hypothetical protein